MKGLDTVGLRETLLGIDEEAWLTFGDAREKLDVVIAGGRRVHPPRTNASAGDA